MSQTRQAQISVAMLVAFGLLLIGMGAWMYLSSRVTRDWSSVEGEVVGVEIRDARLYRGRKGYQGFVSYQYIVDGQAYTSAVFRFGSGTGKTSSYDRAVERVSTYQPGDPVSVYYQPEDPANAALEVGVEWFFGVLIACGLFLIGTAIWFARLHL